MKILTLTVVYDDESLGGYNALDLARAAVAKIERQSTYQIGNFFAGDASFEFEIVEVKE